MAEPRRIHRPSALDVAPRPVAIRSLDYRRSDIVSRVRSEFFEMRGFSPTVEQAARLFDLTRDECVLVLSSLEREGFLRRTPDGRYRLPA
jgi:predicted transcriptional regulator of viral defense system